jgi:hypothetical protein
MMGKLHNNEKGFGVIEGLLIVAVVVLLGYVGYMVYKNHNKTNNSATTANTATTTPAKTTTTPNLTIGQAISTADKKVIVTIPDTWHVLAGSSNANGEQVISVDTDTHICDKYNPGNCSAIAPCLDIEDTVSCTYVAEFQPKALNSQTDQVWGLTVEKSDMTIAQASEQLLGQLSADNTLDKSSNKINGYDAFYVKVKSIGSDSYVDIHYFVTYKGYLIHFSNRVIENNSSINPIHRDYSKYSSDFAKIVNSLKLNF